MFVHMDLRCSQPCWGSILQGTTLRGQIQGRGERSAQHETSLTPSSTPAWQVQGPPGREESQGQEMESSQEKHHLLQLIVAVGGGIPLAWKPWTPLAFPMFFWWMAHSHYTKETLTGLSRVPKKWCRTGRRSVQGTMWEFGMEMGSSNG